MGKWLNCQLFGAVLTPCVGHLCTSALPSALLVQPGQRSLLPYSDHTKVLWGVDSFAEKQLACLSYSAESPSSSCPQPQPVQAPGALPAGTDAAPGSLVSERWLPWARALWWGSDPLWAREQILPASCGKGSVQHIMCSLIPSVWHGGSSMSHHFEMDWISINNRTTYWIFNPSKIMLYVSCLFDIHSFHVPLPQHKHFENRHACWKTV